MCFLDHCDIGIFVLQKRILKSVQNKTSNTRSIFYLVVPSVVNVAARCIFGSEEDPTVRNTIVDSFESVVRQLGLEHFSKEHHKRLEEHCFEFAISGLVGIQQGHHDNSKRDDEDK